MGASENLALNLRNLRVAKGLSINRFAPQLGVSKSTLQEIEQGHAPNLETLECIAQNLGLPTYFLIADPCCLPDTSILASLLDTIHWYSALPQPEQKEFVRLVTTLMDLLTRHTPKSP